MAANGRPRGEVRIALRLALQVGEGTSRELATRTLIGFKAATDTLGNMCQAGEAVVSKYVRRPGVKRPVPVYALADDSHTGAVTPAELDFAIRQWLKPDAPRRRD